MHLTNLIISLTVKRYLKFKIKRVDSIENDELSGVYEIPLTEVGRTRQYSIKFKM